MFLPPDDASWQRTASHRTVTVWCRRLRSIGMRRLSLRIVSQAEASQRALGLARLAIDPLVALLFFNSSRNIQCACNSRGIAVSIILTKGTSLWALNLSLVTLTSLTFALGTLPAHANIGGDHITPCGSVAGNRSGSRDAALKIRWR